MNLVLFFCGGGMGICWVDGWNLIDIYWNFIYGVESWMFTEWLILICFWVEGWTVCISFNGCLTHLLFGLGMFFFFIYGWKWLTYTGICCQSAWHFWWNISWDTMKCGIYFGPGFNMWWTSGVEEFSKMEYKTWYMYGVFLSLWIHPPCYEDILIDG